MDETLALGIDFGTSGARGAVIDSHYRVLAQVRQPYPTSGPGPSAKIWQQVLWALVEGVPTNLRQHIQAIALDGTSGTVLLCDAAGHPLTEPLLYKDDRGRSQLPTVIAIAPSGHPVCSATSSLAKVLWWQANLPASLWAKARYLLHQADWLGYLLHGQLGVSDYHNALKLGYDVGALAYPSWLLATDLNHLLPKVKVPGAAIAPLRPEVAARYGFPQTCQVCAGTTDSIAAFLASGADQPGDGVTSLGSTLVLKLLSQTRVDNSYFGVYSHRLGDLWLVGGASNTGGAVLRQFFTPEQLTDLSRQIDPSQPSPLDYYPLLQPGERFPINDPDLPPRLQPRPSEAKAFLHGLLEGIARIEHQGYSLLEHLGATAVQRIFTSGGGAQNPTWIQIRQRCLQRPIVSALHTEAAVGSARLAQTGVAARSGPMMQCRHRPSTTKRKKSSL